MTNAVDILLVGGPKHGTKVCVARTRMTLADVGNDIANYRIMAWADPLTLEKFWLAKQDSDTLTDEYIRDSIIQHNHTPAWDLNR